jgi:sugar lactone lactonase YvrE
MKNTAIIILGLLGLGTTRSIAQSTLKSTGALIDVFQSAKVWNGVTVSDDGRTFVCYPDIEGEGGLKIAELKKDGTPVPYPDAGWNSWKTGDETEHKIVRANSVRIGPDDMLWIVDTGQPGMGDHFLPGGSKLIAVDLHTNKVVRTIPLDDVLKPKSMADDLRIYGSHIYVTDAGEPALIILDKVTGKGRRVLEDEVSTTDNIPMKVEGKVMVDNNGKEVHINADQLEVSPDGKYMYFQAASGQLYRVEMQFLNNPELSKTELSARVKKWYDTPSTGGTAIDSQGNIYISDVDHSKLFRITPEGKREEIIADSRLIWCDALWIDNKGYLWLPVGQLNRLAVFQNGQATTKFPVHIYKLKINTKPFRI